MNERRKDDTTEPRERRESFRLSDIYRLVEKKLSQHEKEPNDVETVS